MPLNAFNQGRPIKISFGTLAGQTAAPADALKAAVAKAEEIEEGVVRGLITSNLTSAEVILTGSGPLLHRFQITTSGGVSAGVEFEINYVESAESPSDFVVSL